MKHLNPLAAAFDLAQSDLTPDAEKQSLNPDVSRATHPTSRQSRRRGGASPREEGYSLAHNPKPHFEAQEEALPSEEHITHFISEQGFLLHGEKRSVLLDRQVVPFASLDVPGWNRQLRYCRLHALMQSSSQSERAEPVELSQESQPLMHDRILHDESYLMVFAPDCLLGFLGSLAQQHEHLPLKKFEYFLRSAPERSFQTVCQAEDVLKILPAFWVEITDRETEGRPIAEFVEQWQLQEMYNTADGKFGWYRRIHDGPLTSPLPMRLKPDSLERLKTRFYQKYAFRKIHISMPGVMTGVTCASIPENFRPLLDHAVSLEEFTDKLSAEELGVYSFQYRYVPLHQNAARQRWEVLVRDLLMGPARHALARLDGQGSLSF